jgi:5'/3'-nucleotidase
MVLRVLVTNDDGIASPGLRALAEMARDRGHDVLVAAPSWDASGASAAVTGVTRAHSVVAEPCAWPGWPERSVMAVSATPALICRSALEGAYGPPPDIVLSGINAGANTGRAILHSGTVGAALTAHLAQRPGLAVSLGLSALPTGTPPYWGTAALVAGQVFDWLCAEMPLAVINCNVPSVAPGKLKGVRAGRLAPVGAAQASLTEQSGPQFPVTVESGPGDERGGNGRRPDRPVAEDTDVSLLSEGFASVTAVLPVTEDPHTDLVSALASFVLGP